MTKKKLEQQSAFDINKPDPEAIYRFFNVVSYITLLLFIGMPVWWMTTRVYRAPLPLSKMQDVQLRNRPDKPYGLPLSIEYDVLITIVNPDPQNLKVELDGELLDINLQPFLKTVSSVSNFIIKTQWLYLTELGVAPKKFGDYYALNKEQLPHIITPLEKKLWSHLSLRPCINLVLYVSNCKTPLFIHKTKNAKAETNSFLSPRWGGITILNPDPQSCENHLYQPALNPIIAMFIQQLRNLLQIRGNTKLDVHTFKKSRINEMIDSTRRTLKSLAQLLSEINSIVISDEVADKINVAVLNADKAEAYLQNGNVELALRHAKTAFVNSETAFGDSSLLALLYFPEDQKYAVYIPLFLPIMIPVFMSVITIKRWYLAALEYKLKGD